MVKVAALTSSKRDPSTRFRVRQFIEPLRRLGVEVSEHYPLISKYKIEPLPLAGMLLRAPGILAARRSDVTWMGRELISGQATLANFAGTKRLFDVDDAIWLIYKSSFSEEIAKRCCGVIAGNKFIADHYARYGAQRVWIVPTSIDTEKWKPAENVATGYWTIGWTGTWSNLKYLYQVEEALAGFLAEQTDSRLLVVCDRKPVFKKIPDKSWEFAQWSPETEISLVQQMNVGLMPLEDTEWARGKCAFKMLSYMAVGVPVVASPIGVNRELLEQAEIGFAATVSHEWHEALRSLYLDKAMAARMGVNGRRVVEENYSVRRNAIALAQIFREVAGE